MPIIGLTKDVKLIAEGLPILGKLRKGAEKTSVNKPGKDLDHFRFTSAEEYKSLDAEEKFRELYGGTPSEFENALLVSNNVHDAFSTWYEWWGKNEELKVRHDGETVVREYRNHPHNEYQDVSRPANLQEKEKAKPVGRLNILLLDYCEAIGVEGVITVETHSKNDIHEIYKRLTGISSLYGKLTGIPFRFGRINKRISTPGWERQEGGHTGRQVVTKSLFFIDVMPYYTRDVLLPAIKQNLMAVEAVPQIKAPEPKIPSRIKHVEFGARKNRRLKTGINDDGVSDDDNPQPAATFTRISGTSAMKAAPQPDDEPVDGEIIEDDDVLPRPYTLVKVRSAAADMPGASLRFVTEDGEVLNVYEPGVAMLREMGWQVDVWTKKPHTEAQNGFEIEVLGTVVGDALTIEAVNTESEEGEIFSFAMDKLGMSAEEVTKWMSGKDVNDIFGTVDAWLTMSELNFDTAMAHITATAEGRAKDSAEGKA